MQLRFALLGDSSRDDLPGSCQLVLISSVRGLQNTFARAAARELGKNRA